MDKRQFTASIIMLGWKKHDIFLNTWVNPKHSNVFVEVNPKTSTAYLYYGAKYGTNSFKNIFGMVLDLVPDDKYNLKPNCTYIA